ncbi:MAG TPA: hypothetical protein VHO46_05055 [Bacteroidales bacterium]|nr:hypothetical protein [Bacteroidales bacterium]
MTFDNSKTIINVRIKLFAATVILIAYLILAYAAEFIKFPLLGLNDTIWTVILAGLWLFFIIMPLFLNYQFVFFSDDTERIIFRYFNAGIVGGKKNSVEIDKHSFAGYNVDKRFFGLIISLTLFQRFSEGVAKYPPVYISALSKEERSKILRVLSSYTVA